MNMLSISVEKVAEVAFFMELWGILEKTLLTRNVKARTQVPFSLRISLSLSLSVNLLLSSEVPLGPSLIRSIPAILGDPVRYHASPSWFLIQSPIKCLLEPARPRVFFFQCHRPVQPGWRTFDSWHSYLYSIYYRVYYGHT